LPLLTALCSDISLIRSLSKRDETNKQVSWGDNKDEKCFTQN
jgi:hypothetical protein